MRLNLLVVDDDLRMARLVEAALGDWARENSAVLVHRADPESALSQCERQAFQLALVDLHFGQDEDAGFRLIEALRASSSGLEIIAFSSAGSFSAVQRAVRAGAGDYVQKGCSPEELVHALERARERRRLRGIERGVVREHQKIHALLGASEPMERMKALIRKFAVKDAPVLIEGETGSGKELVARALHGLSLRSGGPFVAVDCGAVPASTADSFFFGHERGAFTGADRQRIGALEEAEGGTLFLDEVNSLAPELQNKLLRALQELEIRRLGGSKTIPVDFRLLCAANASLEQLVKSGKFREDLFYRIQVLRLPVPPLRERSEDLELLVKEFLPKRSLSPELWRLLRSHSWPGNVRELKGCLIAMDAIAGDDEELSFTHVPESMLGKMASKLAPDEGASQGASEGDSLSGFQDAQAMREQEFLARAYRTAGGNISKMARLLSLDRSHLHQKLVKLGIHRAKG